MGRYSRLASKLAWEALGCPRRLRGDSWGGGMGPQETEPQKGKREVLERRLESVGREGVVMVWRVGGEGAGSAIEEAMADARAVSRCLGTRGMFGFGAGKVTKGWTEVTGTIGWGAAGKLMDLDDVKLRLENKGWL